MQAADTTTRALQVETKDGVVRLTLDRPDKRNALSQRESEVRDNIDALSEDDDDDDDLRDQLNDELKDLDSQLQTLTRQYVQLSDNNAKLKDQLAQLVQAINLGTPDTTASN